MDIHFIDTLSRGIVLGLAAGFSPGPLTVLVISETLRHGLRAGVKVSLAPVLTDLPIIALAVLLLARLVEGSRAFLSSGAYRWIMRILGLLLILYALLFFKDAGVRFGLFAP
jgi:threonine/homoserine/homoserine lactone efflux protein